MSHCVKNGLGSGGADEPRVLDPTVGERALLKATSEHQASVIERGMRRGGLRGKVKAKWTKEERRVLWECFVRSGGKKGDGYIKEMKALWDERGLSERGEPSLISQLKTIEKGNVLSKVERAEICRMVGQEQRSWREVGESQRNDVGEEQRVLVDQETWMEMFGESDSEAEFEGFEVEQVDDLESTGDRSKHHEELQDDVGGRGEVDLVVTRIDVWRDGDEMRKLTAEEKAVLAKMRDVFGNGLWEEVPNLKTQDRKKVSKEVELVDGLLHNVIQDNMSTTDVNRLLYTGSYIVADRLGLMGKGKGKAEKKKKPWWQRRLERSIEEWRKDLGRVEEIRKGTAVGKVVKDRLERKYGLTENGALAVSTLLKNKIQSGSAKIRWFVEKSVARRQNNLFKGNQSWLYKELGGTAANTADQSPKAAEAKEFWQRIWSVETQHDQSASWLGDVRTGFDGVRQQEKVVVQLEDVKVGIRRMANWKAPGPDGVRGFWFKKFPSLHTSLAASLQKCLDDGDVPAWMVKGRTVLIQKDPAKGTVASNYRPIACLPLMWKLLTGIFAEKIYDHLRDNNLLPDEQKGCRKKSRGTKDQMVIDKAILREARMKKRYLAMGWIDYKKAYDMVPHSWIMEMLDLVKVAGNMSSLLRASMADWRTELTANGKGLGEVSIRRGIFQGDSLSPLLFIMVMIPLSMLLRRENLGYRFGPDRKLMNHLLFMDDLKLYGKTERELDALVEVVRVYSRDIGMEFGLDKCAVLVLRQGMKVRCEGIVLPDGQVMKEVDEGGYKYLGVLEGADIMQREMKEKVRNEYLRRVKLVAKSKLYGGHVFRAINAWAIGVVRYSAGILEWSDKELKKMDVRTRKLLTMFGVFHQKGSVPRLYLKRKDGGRGLIRVFDCVKEEELGLFGYVKESEEWMLQVVGSTLQVGETKADYKKRVEKERVDCLKGKRLHGKFLRDVEGVADVTRSWQWLKGGYLGKTVEGFVMAAQEQALRTRFFRSKIQGEDVDPRCRVCFKEVESVAHLASGCGGLAQREYRRRHDRMGLRVYWELCRKYGVKCSEKWYDESPDEIRVSADKKVSIWWDRSVETTRKMEHNRPDVTVVDHASKVWTFVDFSVPWDKNVRVKEDEKVTKYSPLAQEVRKLHRVATKIIPVVVGSLGIVSDRLARYLEYLGIPDVVGGLQTSALIGTSLILRKVLNL